VCRLTDQARSYCVGRSIRGLYALLDAWPSIRPSLSGLRFTYTLPTTTTTMQPTAENQLTDVQTSNMHKDVDGRSVLLSIHCALVVRLSDSRESTTHQAHGFREQIVMHAIIPNIRTIRQVFFISSRDADYLFHTSTRMTSRIHCRTTAVFVVCL